MWAWLVFMLIPGRGDTIARALFLAALVGNRCLVVSSLRLRLPFIVPRQVPSWKSWSCYCSFLTLNETEWSCWLRGSLWSWSQGPEIKHPSSTGSWWQEAWHGHRLVLFLIYAKAVPRDGWLPHHALGASHFLESRFNKATIISFKGNIPAHWPFDLRIQLLILNSLPSKSYGRGAGTSPTKTEGGHSYTSAVQVF